MKLIYCSSCQDVVRLMAYDRHCECGKCGGRYIDKLNAEYWGDTVIPLGFENQLFVAVMKRQPERGRGQTFPAFVIPRVCASMTKIDHKIKVSQPGDHRDAHTEHCCVRHGCKYSDDDCTVATGKAPQSGPCEECGLELEGYYGDQARQTAVSFWPNDPRSKENTRGNNQQDEED